MYAIRSYYDIVDRVGRALGQVLPGAERALTGTADHHRAHRCLFIQRCERGWQPTATSPPVPLSVWSSHRSTRPDTRSASVGDAREQAIRARAEGRPLLLPRLGLGREPRQGRMVVLVEVA